MTFFSPTGEPLSDPYHILGISPSASSDDIQRAYRKLMLHLHPDKRPHNLADDEAAKVAERFHEVGDAKSFLLDTEHLAARRMYDSRLARNMAMKQAQAAKQAQAVKVKQAQAPMTQARNGRAASDVKSADRHGAKSKDRDPGSRKSGALDGVSRTNGGRGSRSRTGSDNECSTTSIDDSTSTANCDPPAGAARGEARARREKKKGRSKMVGVPGEKIKHVKNPGDKKNRGSSSRGRNKGLSGENTAPKEERGKDDGNHKIGQEGGKFSSSSREDRVKKRDQKQQVGSNKGPRNLKTKGANPTIDKDNVVKTNKTSSREDFDKRRDPKQKVQRRRSFGSATVSNNSPIPLKTHKARSKSPVAATRKLKVGDSDCVDGNNGAQPYYQQQQQHQQPQALKDPREDFYKRRDPQQKVHRRRSFGSATVSNNSPIPLKTHKIRSKSPVAATRKLKVGDSDCVDGNYGVQHQYQHQQQQPPQALKDPKEPPRSSFGFSKPSLFWKKHLHPSSPGGQAPGVAERGKKGRVSLSDLGSMPPVSAGGGDNNIYNSSTNTERNIFCDLISTDNNASSKPSRFWKKSSATGGQAGPGFAERVKKGRLSLFSGGGDNKKPLHCPVSKKVMTDPMTDFEGNSYERAAILKYLETNATSPVTGKPLFPCHLTPDAELKERCSTLIMKNCLDSLGEDC